MTSKFSSRLALLLLLLAGFLPLQARAHIGSPNVFFEGVAGPYPVRISIRPPDVVPGRAQINVRILTNRVARVGALPVRWNAGRKGAPPPDAAKPVQGEPNLFSTELWIMDFGAYSVFVDVEGERGPGTAIVPLNSVSNKKLPMPKWQGVLFGGVGVGLIFLLVMIVGAGVRESGLQEGEQPSRRRIRLARAGMVICFLLLSSILTVGAKWWNAVDRDFRQNKLFQKITAPMQVLSAPEGKLLRLDLAPARAELRDGTPLVPDHGKLMHLFLIPQGAKSAFAHLHPVRSEKSGEKYIFYAPIPESLPSGKYNVFADVTVESGFSQTITGEVDLGAEASKADSRPAADPDDSWWTGQPQGESGNTVFRAPEGWSVIWKTAEKPGFDKDGSFTFEVLAPDGKPAVLDAYMGMVGHLELISEDGDVFTHLHPAGSISMASQELFARREKLSAPQNLKATEIICGRPDLALSFPYSFPRPGKYVLWVQVKTFGKVLTAAFTTEVK
jgi:hypothetical protein